MVTGLRFWTILALSLLLAPVTGQAQAAAHGALASSPIMGHLAGRSPAHLMHATPLAFEPNRGQTTSAVRFLAHGPGYTLFLTKAGAVLSLGSRRGGVSSLAPSRPAVPSIAGAKTGAAVLALLPQSISREVRITVSDRLPGVVSYYMGTNPAGWHTDIPTFGRVTYHNLYPGIDFVLYGTAGAPEYDWVVHPGGNPSRIKLRVAGAMRLALDRQGRLRMQTSLGSIDQEAPRMSQGTHAVSGHFTLLGTSLVGLQVGAYDHHMSLRIDPAIKLGYSTYLGGSNIDAAQAITADANGDAYIAGETASTNFPVCGTFPKCATPGAAIQPANAGSNDAFVSKLDPAGTQLLYSTYLGGSNFDSADGIAIDASGDAYVTGVTQSNNFPVCGTSTKCVSTGTAVQPSLAGGGNAFVTKLNPTGTQLVYSTYLGGSGNDFGHAIAVDGLGDAYVTGEATSTNFPVCGTNPKCAAPGTAIQPTNAGGADAFVSELNPAATQLVYSTYLGGSSFDVANGIAVDGSGDAYVAGQTTSVNFPVCGTNPKCAAPRSAIQATFGGNSDAFVTKISPLGALLLYSTYLGGSGEDVAHAIAVDQSGNAYVAGGTGTGGFTGAAETRDAPPAPTGFPICGTNPKCATPGTAIQPANAGGFDAFVTKLNTAGTMLLYSTYLGGSQMDEAYGIAVDSSGDAFITGYTGSPDFPVCGTYAKCAAPNTAFQPTNMGNTDAFVSELNPTGAQLVFSTFLGGSLYDIGFGIALDGSGDAFVAGSTSSANFPTCPGSDVRCAMAGAALQGTYGGPRLPGAASIGGDGFVAKIVSSGLATITLTARNFSCTAGEACTQVVATFTASSGAPCSTFTATIDWGDGSSSPSEVSGTTSLPAPGCTITGTHEYLYPGSYTVTIHVSSSGATPAEKSATATVVGFPFSTAWTTVVAGNSAVSCPVNRNIQFALGIYVGANSVPTGSFSYRDIAKGLNITSSTGFQVLSVERIGNGPSNGSGNQAVIYGSVGQGPNTTFVRIDISDPSLAGCADSFRLRTSSGYDSSQSNGSDLVAQAAVTVP